MTIRARLAGIYVAAIVITVGLVGVLVWWQLGSALRTSLDEALQARAAAVLTGIENNGQAGLQEGDATTPPGVFVAIFDTNGQPVDATAGVPPGLTAPAPGLVRADFILGRSAYAVHVVTARAVAVVAVAIAVRVVAKRSLQARNENGRGFRVSAVCRFVVGDVGEWLLLAW